MGRDKERYRRKIKPFVMVEKDMINSPAWFSLTNAARVAWIHLAADQNGRNEGQLKLTFGQASLLMDPKTFSRGMADLQRKGFIERTKAGGLMGGCSEYALSNAWRNWQPKDDKEKKKAQRGKITMDDGGNPPR